MPYLTEAQLARALVLADLTDPAYGPHCMQDLVAGATAALRERGCVRCSSRQNWRRRYCCWRVGDCF